MDEVRRQAIVGPWTKWNVGQGFIFYQIPYPIPQTRFLLVFASSFLKIPSSRKVPAKQGESVHFVLLLILSRYFSNI
jgi:hypothetical protein